MYYDDERYDQAIADCEKVLKLDPKAVDAYKYRGNAYKQKGQADKARADWAEAERLTRKE
jgi:tetratricopeptide (TPR) repeat protein